MPAERGKYTRYRVKVLAIFTWKKSGGASFRGEGMTRDISLGGAYVLSSTCPPVNTAVEMEFRLPSFSRALSASITGRMRALRVERDLTGKGKIGFSVAGKGSISRRRTRTVKPLALKKKRS